jgi:hypothetical protein
MDTSDWPVIVILDHPDIKGLTSPTSDVFWITMDDWALINQGIASITYLIWYVQWALGEMGGRDPPVIATERSE